MQDHPQVPAQVTARRVDRDGITHTRYRASRMRLVLLAALLLGGTLAVALWMLLTLSPIRAATHRSRTPAEPTSQGPARPSAAGPATAAPHHPMSPEDTPLAGDPLPAEEDTMPSDSSSGRSGVALFPPPGTKPIKRGILVPEDFPLPPGYVRHYQATDDGDRVPAILMFHPDFQPLDNHGAPVKLPDDRVVPPELAPPGMPIQMLDPPKVRKDDGEPAR